MIRFFRKIRQRLMTENLSVHEAGLQIKKEGGASKSTRTARYMLYAIGEIALVMIGPDSYRDNWLYK